MPNPAPSEIIVTPNTTPTNDAAHIISTVRGFTSAFQRGVAAFHTNALGSEFWRNQTATHRVAAALIWRGLVPQYMAFQQWCDELVYDGIQGVTEIGHLNPFRIPRRKEGQVQRLKQKLRAIIEKDIQDLKNEQLALERRAIMVQVEFNQYFNTKKIADLIGENSTLFDAFSNYSLETKLDELKSLLRVKLSQAQSDQAKETLENDLEQRKNFLNQLFDIETAWLAADAKLKEKEKQRVLDYGSTTAATYTHCGLDNKYPAVILGATIPVIAVASLGLIQTGAGLSAIGSAMFLALPFFAVGGGILAITGWKHVNAALWYGAFGRLVGTDADFENNTLDPQSKRGWLGVALAGAAFGAGIGFIVGGPLGIGIGAALGLLGGGLIAGIGLANIVRAIKALAIGAFEGIRKGCKWGVRPIEDFNTLKSLAKESLWSMPTVFFTGIPSFALGFAARGFIDLFYGLGSGIKHGFMLGAHLFSKEKRDAYLNSLKSHITKRNFLALGSMAISSVVAGLVGLVVRQFRDFFYGLGSGIMHGFMLAATHFVDHHAQQAYVNSIKHHLKEKNILALGSMTISSILSSAVGLAAREVRDFFYGVGSGIELGFKLGANNIGKADQRAYTTTLFNHIIDTNFLAVGSMVISTAGSVVLGAIARQFRDFLYGISSGIEHGFMLGAAHFDSAKRDAYTKALKAHIRARNLLAVGTMAISSVFAIAVGMIARQFRDFFYGLGSGISRGFMLGAMQFSLSERNEYVNTMKTHISTRNFLAVGTMAISSFFAVGVGVVARQFYDFTYGFASGVKHGLLLGANHFAKENRDAYGTTLKSYIKDRNFLAVGTMALSTTFSLLVGLVSRQFSDFFYGFGSGIGRGFMLGANNFAAVEGNAYLESMKHHIKQRNILAVGTMALGSIPSIVIGVFARQFRNFFEGLASGIKHTFTTAWRFYDSKSRKGFADTWKHHQEARNYTGLATMVLGVAIAAAPATLIGLFANIKKITPMTIAAMAFIAKHVIYKSIKAIITAPAKILGGFVANLNGGFAYAFAKVASHLSKTLPLIRKFIPAFRAWNIALDPLKRQLDAIPSSDKPDSQSSLRSDFLDDVSQTLLTTLKDLQQGNKSLSKEGLLKEGEGISHSIARQIPFFPYDKDSEQLLKRFHEYLLEGKVVFQGANLPAAMQDYSKSADNKDLPNYKFRFFQSGSPNQNRHAILEGCNHQFDFTIENGKLIVNVLAKKPVVKEELLASTNLALA